MNAPERSGAPALGNAIGYFAALYAMSQVAWLEGQDPAIVTAMMGTVFIHVFLEIRLVIVSIGKFIAGVFK